MGKTSTTLAFVHAFFQNKVAFIVVPAPVQDQWREEEDRLWQAWPQIRRVKIWEKAGKVRQPMNTLYECIKNKNIVVMSRDRFLKINADYGKFDWNLVDFIVVDEAHEFSNPSSQRHKKLQKVLLHKGLSGLRPKAETSPKVFLMLTGKYPFL